MLIMMTVLLGYIDLWYTPFLLCCIILDATWVPTLAAQEIIAMTLNTMGVTPAICHSTFLCLLTIGEMHDIVG